MSKQANFIQHALEEARGISAGATINKIRKEVAEDIFHRHGDWSVNPHLENGAILVGEGMGEHRRVYKITIELVAEGNNFIVEPE